MHQRARTSRSAPVGWLALALALVSTPLIAIAQDSADTNAISDLEALLNIEVSSAMKYERKAADIPASVTLITSEDIERYGFRNPLEAIATLTGMYLSYDRNYWSVGVRGFGRPADYNNRITILLNGHVLNENYYHGGYIGSELPLSIDAVDRIEVIRGPGSVLYGTGAMFAVINIVTKSVSTLEGAILRAGVGQFGEFSGSGIISRRMPSGTELTLSGSWTDISGRNLYFPAYDELATNYGVSEREDWEKSHGVLGVLSHGGLRVQGMYTNRWKGIPTGAWGTVFNSDNAKTLDRLAHGEISYDARVYTATSLSARLYYDHYHYAGTFPYEEVLNMDANWSHALGSELRLTFDPRPNHRIVVGLSRDENLQVRYKYWDVPAPVYYDKNVPYHTMSAYIQDEFQILASTAIIVGLRHDHSSIAPPSTTPRVGIVYKPTSSTTIKGLYGQAFRAPSVYELYWDNSNIGYEGNPDLHPEQIRTTEVIIEQRLGAFLQTNLSIFKYRLQEIIDFSLSPIDSVQVYENAGGVSTRGIELGLSARLPHHIAGFANYSFQDSHDQNDRELTNSPQHVATMGTAVPLRPGLVINAIAHAESGRRSVHDSKTAPYATIDFGISLTSQILTSDRAKEHSGRTRLQIRVTNAFDAAYATPGGYEQLSDAIPQDGRGVRATLRVQL